MKTLTEFALDKQCIDRISFRKFLGFPGTYQIVPKSNHSEK